MRVVTADEVIKLLGNRRYKWAQVHHTWKPSHKDFNGRNHLRLQQNMKNYHVNTNGWSDIGQHLTLFPDGKFVTGRAFNRTPAGIKGYNTGAFMIEMIGNFDKGHDKLEGKQLDSALKVYKHLVDNGAKILFHREKAVKTCPGTGISKSTFVRQVNNYGGKVTVSSKWTKVTGNWTGQTLRQGQYGKPVKQLQELLASNHYYPNKGAKNNGIDSYYGTDTKDAVERYQSMHGLTVDGLAGKSTYSSLKGASSKKNGWKKQSGKWFYYKNGKKQKGWLKDGGRWYWLDQSGVMQKGFVQVDGKTYFMNLAGRMTEDQDLTFTAAKSGELTLKK